MQDKRYLSTGVDNPWFPEGGPGRHLKARLKRGDVLIGPMLQEHARPSVVKLFQHAGFDFIFIEYEHTYFSLADLADTILCSRDNGLPVIVKTPQLERHEVGKLLEAGVSGIQLPRTETREEVEELVSYLKFPPSGTRAIAPGWGSSDYRVLTDWSKWMVDQDKETTVVLHFETAKAYVDAEQLISVPGVDMVYCGPGDTSIELGHPGDYDHPDVVGPMENVLQLCKKYGVAWGTTTSGGKSAGEWVRKGASFFETIGEMDFIRMGASAVVNDFRENF